MNIYELVKLTSTFKFNCDFIEGITYSAYSAQTKPEEESLLKIERRK